jgi:hypothetical protein
MLPFCWVFVPFLGGPWLDAAVLPCVAFYVLLPFTVSVTSIAMQLLRILGVLFVSEI